MTPLRLIPKTLHGRGAVKTDSWTVTTDVSNFVTGVQSNYGWIVKDSTESAAADYYWRFHSNNAATDSNKPKLAVTFTAPWDSYESDYSTTRDTYTSGFTTAYMKGTGFTNTSYLIAYYDANGVKRSSETQSASGGNLTGAYLLANDETAAPGTWHALVQPSSGYTGFGTESYATIIASPDTYGLLANDSFIVEQGAIPEFPTLFTGIGVAGMCAVIYLWMRRRLVDVEA